MLPSPRHRVYKSLETDEEFIARIVAWIGDVSATYYANDFKTMRGEKLDGFVWGYFGKQRKIIERES